MDVKVIEVTLRPRGKKPAQKIWPEEKVRKTAYNCAEEVWWDPSLDATRTLQRAMQTLADYGEYEMPLTLDNVMNGVVAGIQRDSHRSIMHHREGFDFIPANCTLSAVEVGLVNIMSRKTVGYLFLKIRLKYVAQRRERNDQSMSTATGAASIPIPSEPSPPETVSTNCCISQ